MRSYYTYTVECRDGALYVGVTNDVERRVGEHNAGLLKAHFTFYRRPVRLVWAAQYAHVDDAIACEKQLKGWRREKKLALIRGDFAALRALSHSSQRRVAAASTGSAWHGAPPT